MRRIERRIAILLCAVVMQAPLVAHAQEQGAQEESDVPPALLLIMDSSGSMGADDGTGRPKIEAAKAALRSLIAQLPDDGHVGLRVYGHRVPNTDKNRGCKDSELIVPVAPLDRPRLRTAISGFEPKGWTPIGLSLRLGAGDLPPEGKRTIILVSDGIDTCAPPPPCEVARKLTRQGVDLTVQTVGFQVNSRARRELRCIARVSGGAYRDANDAKDLARRLRSISRRSLRVYRSPGMPVVGGAAYGQAPLLEPGLYSDTILASESLWYEVELGAGEEMVVKATLDRGTKGLAGGALFEIQIVSPQLEDLCCGDERGYQVNLEERVVSVTARSGIIGSDDSLVPGTYYIRATCDACTDSSIEQPLEIGIEVTGLATPSPSPSITETPEEAETPAETGAESEQAAAEDSSSGSLVAVIVLLSVLIVLLLIVVALMWRRGSRT